MNVNKNEKIEELSQRFHLSREAVMALFHALLQGKGTMAQFNHSELGGAGQWMSGGMVMIGDMFNQTLKAQVNDVCTELSHWIESSQFSTPTSFPFVEAWWPSEWGEPTLVGSQNETHYAYFSKVKRLIIRQGEHLSIYDTQDHQISGVSQQQNISLVFTSQQGQVNLSRLPLLSGNPVAQTLQEENVTPVVLEKQSKKRSPRKTKKGK